MKIARAFIRSHGIAWTIALLLVLALRLGTPIAKVMTDGAEYLNVAVSGLKAEAHLGAPFAYRPAVPLCVHLISLATGAGPLEIFPVVAFIAGVILLAAVYHLALLTGAPRGTAILIMILMCSSLFMVRFPLYCPYDVDIEACVVSLAAFAALMRRNYVATLAVALPGLLFKEFLLAPLAVLAVLFLQEYIRERSTRSLQWVTAIVVLTLVVFVLPRLLIPVTSAFGTSLQYKVDAPSHTLYFTELRMFLAWPPRVGTPVNLLLALVSFWLPGLMLIAGGRARAFREALGTRGSVALLWTAAVLLLMSVGGTKIMVFVTYTAPVLVLALVVLLGMDVRRGEMVILFLGTAIFNRILFPLGAPGGDPGADIAFYGAYRHEMKEATAWRFAEAAGWILLAWCARRISRRGGREP